MAITPGKFGSDFSLLTDVGPAMRFLEGEENEERAFLEALVRRLSTPRGGLFYDDDYGLDLRAFLNSNVSPNQIAYQVENELRKDERVEDCTAEATVQSDGTILLEIEVKAGEEPFDLTVLVNEVTVTMLNAQQTR
jgi:hypothetical protein